MLHTHFTVHATLYNHENVEAIQLLDNMGIMRRLQRKNPFELV
jgi:hypothetical protein